MPENMLVSFDSLYYGYIGEISISKVLDCKQVELKRQRWTTDVIVWQNLMTESTFIDEHYINRGISSELVFFFSRFT